MRLSSTLASTAAAARPAPALAVLFALFGMATVHAGTASYQGQFSTDDQLSVTEFVLLVDESFRASTLGYGGGTNGSGGAVAAGGFAPVLALFLDGFGLLEIARGSSTTCGPGAGSADPVSGFCWDAGFSALLPAGRYTLVLSQDGNEPLGQSLADGYARTGQPDYTGLAYLGQAGARFIQVDGTPRNGAWAVDLQAASVPEPGTWLVLLMGVASLALRRLPTRTRD